MFNIIRKVGADFQAFPQEKPGKGNDPKPAENGSRVFARAYSLLNEINAIEKDFYEGDVSTAYGIDLSNPRKYEQRLDFQAIISQFALQDHLVARPLGVSTPSKSGPNQQIQDLLTAAEDDPKMFELAYENVKRMLSVRAERFGVRIMDCAFETIEMTVPKNKERNKPADFGPYTKYQSASPWFPVSMYIHLARACKGYARYVQLSDPDNKKRIKQLLAEAKDALLLAETMLFRIYSEMSGNDNRAQAFSKSRSMVGRYYAGNDELRGLTMDQKDKKERDLAALYSKEHNDPFKRAKLINAFVAHCKPLFADLRVKMDLPKTFLLLEAELIGIEGFEKELDLLDVDDPSPAQATEAKTFFTKLLNDKESPVIDGIKVTSFFDQKHDKMLTTNPWLKASLYLDLARANFNYSGNDALDTKGKVSALTTAVGHCVDAETYLFSYYQPAGYFSDAQVESLGKEILYDYYNRYTFFRYLKAAGILDEKNKVLSGFETKKDHLRALLRTASKDELPCDDGLRDHVWSSLILSRAIDNSGLIADLSESSVRSFRNMYKRTPTGTIGDVFLQDEDEVMKEVRDIFAYLKKIQASGTRYFLEEPEFDRLFGMLSETYGSDIGKNGKMSRLAVAAGNRQISFQTLSEIFASLSADQKAQKSLANLYMSIEFEMMQSNAQLYMIAREAEAEGKKPPVPSEVYLKALLASKDNIDKAKGLTSLIAAEYARINQKMMQVLSDVYLNMGIFESKEWIDSNPTPESQRKPEILGDALKHISMSLEYSSQVIITAPESLVNKKTLVEARARIWLANLVSLCKPYELKASLENGSLSFFGGLLAGKVNITLKDLDDLGDDKKAVWAGLVREGFIDSFGKVTDKFYQRLGNSIPFGESFFGTGLGTSDDILVLKLILRNHDLALAEESESYFGRLPQKVKDKKFVIPDVAAVYKLKGQIVLEKNLASYDTEDLNSAIADLRKARSLFESLRLPRRSYIEASIAETMLSVSEAQLALASSSFNYNDYDASKQKAADALSTLKEAVRLLDNVPENDKTKLYLKKKSCLILANILSRNSATSELAGKIYMKLLGEKVSLSDSDRTMLNNVIGQPVESLAGAFDFVELIEKTPYIKRTDSDMYFQAVLGKGNYYVSREEIDDREILLAARSFIEVISGPLPETFDPHNRTIKKYAAFGLAEALTRSKEPSLYGLGRSIFASLLKGRDADITTEIGIVSDVSPLKEAMPSGIDPGRIVDQLNSVSSLSDDNERLFVIKAYKGIGQAFEMDMYSAAEANDPGYTKLYASAADHYTRFFGGRENDLTATVSKVAGNMAATTIPAEATATAEICMHLLKMGSVAASQETSETRRRTVLNETLKANNAFGALLDAKLGSVGHYLRNDDKKQYLFMQLMRSDSFLLSSQVSADIWLMDKNIFSRRADADRQLELSKQYLGMARTEFDTITKNMFNLNALPEGGITKLLTDRAYPRAYGEVISRAGLHDCRTRYFSSLELVNLDRRFEEFNSILSDIGPVTGAGYLLNYDMAEALSLKARITEGFETVATNFEAVATYGQAEIFSKIGYDQWAGILIDQAKSYTSYVQKRIIKEEQVSSDFDALSTYISNLNRVLSAASIKDATRALAYEALGDIYLIFAPYFYDHNVTVAGLEDIDSPESSNAQAGRLFESALLCMPEDHQKVNDIKAKVIVTLINSGDIEKAQSEMDKLFSVGAKVGPETFEPLFSNDPAASAIKLSLDLKDNGYLDGSGRVTRKFFSLSSPADLKLSDEFSSERKDIYSYLSLAGIGNTNYITVVKLLNSAARIQSIDRKKSKAIQIRDNVKLLLDMFRRHNIPFDSFELDIDQARDYAEDDNFEKAEAIYASILSDPETRGKLKDNLRKLAEIEYRAKKAFEEGNLLRARKEAAALDARYKELTRAEELADPYIFFMRAYDSGLFNLASGRTFEAYKDYMSLRKYGANWWLDSQIRATTPLRISYLPSGNLVDAKLSLPYLSAGVQTASNSDIWKTAGSPTTNSLKLNLAGNIDLSVGGVDLNWQPSYSLDRMNIQIPGNPITVKHEGFGSTFDFGKFTVGGGYSRTVDGYNPKNDEERLQINGQYRFSKNMSVNAEFGAQAKAMYGETLLHSQPYNLSLGFTGAQRFNDYFSGTLKGKVSVGRHDNSIPYYYWVVTHQEDYIPPKDDGIWVRNILGQAPSQYPVYFTQDVSVPKWDRPNEDPQTFWNKFYFIPEKKSTGTGENLIWHLGATITTNIKTVDIPIAHPPEVNEDITTQINLKTMRKATYAKLGPSGGVIYSSDAFSVETPLDTFPEASLLSSIDLSQMTPIEATDDLYIEDTNAPEISITANSWETKVTVIGKNSNEDPFPLYYIRTVYERDEQGLVKKTIYFKDLNKGEDERVISAGGTQKALRRNLQTDISTDISGSLKYEDSNFNLALSLFYKNYQRLGSSMFLLGDNPDEMPDKAQGAFGGTFSAEWRVPSSWLPRSTYASLFGSASFLSGRIDSQNTVLYRAEYGNMGKPWLLDFGNMYIYTEVGGRLGYGASRFNVYLDASWMWNNGESFTDKKLNWDFLPYDQRMGGFKASLNFGIPIN